MCTTLPVVLFDDEAISGRDSVFVDDAIVGLVRRQREKDLHRCATLCAKVDLDLNLPDRRLRAGQKRDAELVMTKDGARDSPRDQQRHQKQKGAAVRHWLGGISAGGVAGGAGAGVFSCALADVARAVSTRGCT